MRMSNVNELHAAQIALTSTECINFTSTLTSAQRARLVISDIFRQIQRRVDLPLLLRSVIRIIDERLVTIIKVRVVRVKISW